MGMRWPQAAKLSARYAGPVAAGLLLAVLAAFGGLFAYASLGRLPAGLTVSGWAVGGMPYAAFDAALTARTEALAKTPVQLRTSAYGLPPLQTTYGQLGVQTSAAELRAQLARLQHGTAWQRARERWRLRGAALELRVTLPEAGVTALLRPAWPQLYTAQPVDARRVITADDRVTYVREQPMPRVDAARLSAALLAAAPRVTALAPGAGAAGAAAPQRGGSGASSGASGDGSSGDASGAKGAMPHAALDGGATAEEGVAARPHAAATGEGPAAGPGAATEDDGASPSAPGGPAAELGTLGAEPSAAQRAGASLAAAGPGPEAAAAAPAPAVAPGALVTLDVPLTQEAPRVTMAALQAEGVERKFAQFTTVYSQSAAGRQHNIEATASIVQDTYLKPGDIFDYAKVIEETQRKFGFQEAPVILNGTIVPGIGGGICQVSTTLYNAVLRGGLEIVERRSHSLPISYVPMGQDATFSTGYINFRFRNNTGYGLLIRTEAGSGRLTVKLFGKTPQDVTYEVHSKIVKTIDPPVKYVRNRTLRRGQQQTVIEGKRGYVVETTRYKKQNGAIVGQEVISRDTYAAQPTVVGINTGSEAADGSDNGSEVPAPHIEDGVQGPKFN